MSKPGYTLTITSILRIIRFIRALGWRSGWRYWQLHRRAARDPQFVSRWAKVCIAYANEVEGADPMKAAIFREWARRLTVCCVNYDAPMQTGLEPLATVESTAQADL